MSVNGLWSIGFLKKLMQHFFHLGFRESQRHKSQ